MNYKLIEQNFLSELKKAAANQKSSLSFIKNHLSQKPLVKQGIVQAIVIGGTNYISALAKLNNGKYKILKRKKGALPVFKTGNGFGSFLSKILDARAQAMGLNFAFPIKPVIGPDTELDGLLIRGTKEHLFRELIGKSIGQFVRKMYFKQYKRQISVAVANDTVCTTLAGSGTEDGAIIAGTGFNIGLIQKNGKKTYVINLEAGNFNKILGHVIRKKIDDMSENPGKMLFEKSVSGRYLVEYFNEQASLAGSKMKLKTTEDLSSLAGKSKTFEAELAKSTLKQSAIFVACAIAAIYEFKNKPKKLEFVTEGSLFWKGYKYKKNVEIQLSKLGVPKNAIKFKFVKDSSLKGAIGLLT